MTQFGTRSKATLRKERMPQGHQTRYMRKDLGMTKLVTASLTFASATARVTGAGGTFPATGQGAFSVGDELLVEGVNLNNGYFNVTGRDAGSGAYLVLDPPPKDEGPLTAVLRTP